MDHGCERRNGHEAALREVQRPAPKPWSGVGAALPARPKVYLVEPRDFRELVQRLTGAGTTAAAAGPAMDVRQAGPAMDMRQAAAAHAVAPHGRREASAAEQFDYASWFAPLFSPASMPAGLHGHNGNGALI